MLNFTKLLFIFSCIHLVLSKSIDNNTYLSDDNLADEETSFEDDSIAKAFEYMDEFNDDLPLEEEDDNIEDDLDYYNHDLPLEEDVNVDEMHQAQYMKDFMDKLDNHTFSTHNKTVMKIYHKLKAQNSNMTSYSVEFYDKFLHNNVSKPDYKTLYKEYEYLNKKHNNTSHNTSHHTSHNHVQHHNATHNATTHTNTTTIEPNSTENESTTEENEFDTTTDESSKDIYDYDKNNTDEVDEVIKTTTPMTPVTTTENSLNKHVFDTLMDEYDEHEEEKHDYDEEKHDYDEEKDDLDIEKDILEEEKHELANGTQNEVKQHEIEVKQHEIDVKKHEIDVKKHELEHNCTLDWYMFPVPKLYKIPENKNQFTVPMEISLVHNMYKNKTNYTTEEMVTYLDQHTHKKNLIMFENIKNRLLKCNMSKNPVFVVKDYQNKFVARRQIINHVIEETDKNYKHLMNNSEHMNNITHNEELVTTSKYTESYGAYLCAKIFKNLPGFDNVVNTKIYSSNSLESPICHIFVTVCLEGDLLDDGVMCYNQNSKISITNLPFYKICKEGLTTMC